MQSFEKKVFGPTLWHRQDIGIGNIAYRLWVHRNQQFLPLVNPGLLCVHADFERFLNHPHRLEHLKRPRLDVKSTGGLCRLVEPIDKAALDAASEEFARQGQSSWPGTDNQHIRLCCWRFRTWCMLIPLPVDCPTPNNRTVEVAAITLWNMVCKE